MTVNKLIEDVDYWIIPVQGMQVACSFVDRALNIQFRRDEHEITVRIEGAFSFKTEKEEYKLLPEQPIALGPVFDILNKAIDSAWAYRKGSLYLKFSDGNILLVEPDPKYEAWEIAGTGGLRVVCLPGGELSIWQPSSSAEIEI